MKAVIHNECGEIAFYLDSSVSSGDLVEASKAYCLNGERPEPRTLITCFACGKHLGHGCSIDWDDDSYEIPKAEVQADA